MLCMSIVSYWALWDIHWWDNLIINNFSAFQSPRALFALENNVLAIWREDWLLKLKELLSPLSKIFGVRKSFSICCKGKVYSTRWNQVSFSVLCMLYYVKLGPCIQRVSTLIKWIKISCKVISFCECYYSLQESNG